MSHDHMTDAAFHTLTHLHEAEPCATTYLACLNSFALVRSRALIAIASARITATC